MPELAKIGYAGLFFPKTRSKTMNEEDKMFVDGCALFYRHGKFILVKDYVIEFNKSLSQYSNNCEPIFNRVMIKDNIGLAALLKLNPLYMKQYSINDSILSNSSGFVLVTNAHIHWDPEFSDVKFIQVFLYFFIILVSLLIPVGL